MKHGLTQVQARKRLLEEGANELSTNESRSVGGLIKEIVSEPMFLLLVACGVLYMLLGNTHEALMLLGFVVVVMGITFVQKRRSERSLEALRDLSSPRALVVRDGLAIRIAGRELVREDCVLLGEGDRVPADMQVVESSGISVDESLLTGESIPVIKNTSDWVFSPKFLKIPNPRCF